MEEKVASSALAPSPDAPSEAVGASLNVSDDKAESKEERLEEINFVKDPKLDLLEIIKKLESSDMRVGWVERQECC